MLEKALIFLKKYSKIDIKLIFLIAAIFSLQPQKFKLYVEPLQDLKQKCKMLIQVIQ